MVATKRFGDHSNSSSDDSLTRKRDDDVEAMLRTRKQLKTTTTTTLKPSSGSKMNWSKNDELVILGEKETKSSYRPDWAALYLFIKDNVEAKFSKKQFIDKVKRLKRKFTYNQGRSNDGKDVSFTDTDDDEIFKLSMIIWAKSETEHVVSNEDMDQAKDVPSGEQENVPCAEQERVNVEIDNGEKEKLDQAKVVPCAEQEDKNTPSAEKEDEDVPCAELEDEDVPGSEKEDKNVPCAEQEQVSNEIDDNGEKEMIEEDGVDEIGVMEDTLESVISFQSLAENGEKDKSEEDGVGVLLEILEADTFYQNCGKYQQKLLRQNLEKGGAERRKELIDEWKALLVQEMKLSTKKFNFMAKFAKAGVFP